VRGRSSRRGALRVRQGRQAVHPVIALPPAKMVPAMVFDEGRDPVMAVGACVEVEQGQAQRTLEPHRAQGL
jgi:hypothetical protein